MKNETILEMRDRLSEEPNSYNPNLHVKHEVPGYKQLYLNQKQNNKILLWVIGISWFIGLTYGIGQSMRYKADTSRLQGQYDIAYKYMLGYESESNYYKTELATVSAELQMSKLSYKAKQDMKQHPKVVGLIKYWSGDQWPLLVELYSRESSLNPGAVNQSSGACGLPQALPCSKMACSLDDIDCQLAWGLSYISKRYGTPQAALNHSYMTGWY
jgi:hypothetical protein